MVERKERSVNFSPDTLLHAQPPKTHRFAAATPAAHPMPRFTEHHWTAKNKKKDLWTYSSQSLEELVKTNLEFKILFCRTRSHLKTNKSDFEGFFSLYSKCWCRSAFFFFKTVFQLPCTAANICHSVTCEATKDSANALSCVLPHLEYFGLIYH